MNRLKAKLQQKKGETLAEVMVAILVSVAGMLLLSSLIMASTGIVSKGNQSMKIMYDGSTIMDTRDTSEATTTVDQNKGLKVTYKNGAETVTDVYVNIYKDDQSKLVSYTQEEIQP